MAFQSFSPLTHQNITGLFRSLYFTPSTSSISHFLSLKLPAADMAVLGNLALLLDVTSPRTGVLDWKTRPMPSDVVLNLFKKEPHQHNPNPNPYLSLSFEFDKEIRNQRAGVRGKTNSKVNAVDYDNSSDDESNGKGNGNGEEDGGFDWEMQMRKRVKEIQEMKELEKKAEELQNQMGDGDGEDEGNEETEEQKRMRVRIELEKVDFISSLF